MLSGPLELDSNSRKCCEVHLRSTPTTRPTLSTSPLKASLLRMPLTRTEQRIVLILKDGQFTLNVEDAAEWRRDLPAAKQSQHVPLDRGELPVKMTLPNV